MEFDFDDALSEDWVSQPRSSSASSAQHGNSLRRSVTSGSVSRIPRLQAQHRRSISKVPQDQILVEKTASDLNAPKVEHSSKFRTSLRLPRTKSTPAPSESLSSRVHGTVQHRDNIGNEVSQSGETPEWKRRLLGGNNAPTRRQDLFSPIGLEHVFRPPTIQSKKPAKRQLLRRNKSTSPQSELFPSSPPPFPTRVKSFHSRSSSDPPLQSLLEVDDSPPVKKSTSQDLNGPANTKHNTPSTAYERDKEDNNARETSQHQTKSRVQSGRSAIQHESFSPAQIEDAQVFNTGSKHPTDPHSAKPSLFQPDDRMRACSRSSDSGLDYRWTARSKDDCMNEDADADCTSISLPKNLSVDSRAFAANGGFITTKRGGYSDSFFHDRPLSPSSFQKGSTPIQKDLRTQATLLDEPELPLPKTPAKLVESVHVSPDCLRSSGSPLKLFDKYDTFTTDRLARRISQFEHDSERTAIRRESNDEAPVDSPSPDKPFQEQDLRKGQVRDKRLSSFGLGDLDSYNFTHRHSGRGKSSSPSKELSNGEATRELPHMPHNPQPRSEHASDGTHKLTAYYEQLTLSKQTKIMKETRIHENVQENVPEIHNQDGKRFLNSPEKRIPTAKRRRTINEDSAPVQPRAEERLQASNTSSVAGKKRKDAKYEDSSQQADPDTIATRPMLRPKTPHASQTRLLSQPLTERGLLETEEEHVNLDVNAATEVLAGELAHMALDVAKDMTNGGRKASVTTADFFKEANMIMQHIRAQARPQYGRQSYGPFDSDQLPNIEESLLNDLTKEEFSRPASRDGQPQKSPGPRSLSARVVSHLRKFEDSDELGLALNSSIKTLAIPAEVQKIEPTLPQDDASYIRILNRPAQKLTKEGQKTDEQHESVSSNEGKLLSNHSGASTNRSLPTGSSRGSANRAVIAPEKVSHLIGENMGRMTFDHGKQCWVKRKTSEATNENGSNQLDSEATEEDLFKEIPDLDVDESQEMKHIRAITTSSRPSSSGTLPEESHDRQHNDHDSQTGGNIQAIPRAPVHDSESSAISRYTRFTSSGPRTETRATSWGDELPKVEDLMANGLVRERHASHDQARRSLHKLSRKQQARAFTVTFSSPLINPQIRQSSTAWSSGDRGDLSTPEDLSDLDGQDGLHGQSPLDTGPLPGQWMGRKLSAATQAYAGRPVSRIDEDDEVSFQCPEAKQTSAMGLTVTTPQALRSMSEYLPLPPPTAGTSSIGFHLSPLPDFTVHQINESVNLDVDYIARRRGLLSVQEVEGKFSLAIRDLVQKITDVEPYEPYWEYIRMLDLHNRGLLTLHMLDEFCRRIEELDVSNNELGQLNGAPESLRILSARNNCLSSLTAWGHLHNLQYLDVSANQIASLKAFHGLVHLRELRVENNEIESLDGITGLNGLIKLKVGRNRLTRLSFEGCNL